MSDRPRSFQAILEQVRGGLGWAIVRVSFVPGDAWTKMMRLRRSGIVNGSDVAAYYFRSRLVTTTF
jgi:hypothetical protein